MTDELQNDRLLEAELLMERATLEEKPKTSWFDLPFEMREMIIDEMDSKTRRQFAMCSKQCEKEAKESNNYLYSISIGQVYNCVVFHFTSDKSCRYPADYYRVVFKDPNRSGPNFKRAVEIFVDGNLEETIASFVLETLEKYKKSLRQIEIRGRDYNLFLPKINFNIFRKLEEIDVHYYATFPKYYDISRVVGFDKILRTQYVNLPQFNFTFDQILKFEGRKARIRSNEMDEENIKKYLKMLQNGEVGQNIEMMYFHMSNEVDFENIIDGLDVDHFTFIESGFHFNMTSKGKENESREIWVDYSPNDYLVKNW